MKTEDDMHRHHLPAQDLPVQKLSDWLSAQDNNVSIDAFSSVVAGVVNCLQACLEDDISFVFHCKQMTPHMFWALLIGCRPYALQLSSVRNFRSAGIFVCAPCEGTQSVRYRCFCILIAQDVIDEVYGSTLCKTWHILIFYLPIHAHLDLAAASHTVRISCYVNCKILCSRHLQDL